MCIAQRRTNSSPGERRASARCLVDLAIAPIQPPRPIRLRSPRRAAGVSPLFGGPCNRTNPTSTSHSPSLSQASGGRQPAVWWTLQSHQHNLHLPFAFALPGERRASARCLVDLAIAPIQPPPPIRLRTPRQAAGVSPLFVSVQTN
jgi:hypothetical protein